VRAFQRRWRQSRVSGEGDPETVSAVHEVARLTQAETQHSPEP
jgi:N-acetyl-anhydromuramyl-L-alanine amidase AmpD